MNFRDPIVWARIGQSFLLTSHDRRMGTCAFLRDIDSATVEALTQVAAGLPKGRVWEEGIKIMPDPFDRTCASLRGLRQKDLRVIYDALKLLWPARRSRLGELRQHICDGLNRAKANEGDLRGVLASIIDRNWQDGKEIELFGEFLRRVAAGDNQLVAYAEIYGDS